MQRNSNQMMVDWYGDGLGLCFSVKEKIVEKQSKYQKIEIYMSEHFGKLLFLDGVLQSVEKFEENYHEILVHPAIFPHPDCKKVLILGGGEGATLREVLKHPVEKAKMVDIDGEMVEIAKKYLKYDRGAFSDKRTELIIDDGVKVIEKEKEMYDVIIIDATDPTDNSHPLYSEDFYRKCFPLLSEKGIFTTYAGNGYYFGKEQLKRIYTNMKSVFDKVKIYSFPIAGFLPGFSFAMGVKGDINIEKIPEKKDIELKYYTPEIQPYLFVLPAFFKKEISSI